ncbi:Phospholipid-transporting ATPase 3 [Phytophthora fragariae]|uniref:Phospholipid-transporting ATPase n=1 Tax=Phytophthora fragariae TaxID=53985 RepID=A0A6A4DIR5_9STRA|nr:Phospholipid-transporting ATPase 3 [Phytophthora fragariae]
MDRGESDASAADTPRATQAQYHRLQPSPVAGTRASESAAFPPPAAPSASPLRATVAATVAPAAFNPSRYFHRNQTVEVLPRQPAGPSDLATQRPNSELFRTLTSSQLLNFRQRLLDDDASDAPTRADLLTRHGTASSASTPTAAAQGYGAGYLRSESWRMFYRNLPRSLRFRQNTRSTTRYIDPANAASLRSRVRARKQEEQARNEGRTEPGSPVPGRELTDFEREMANARAGTATDTSSARDGGASSAAGPPAMTPKGSHKTLDRMSSLLSTDSQGAPLGQRKQYKIVKINDAANAPKREPTGAEADAEEGEEFFVSNEVKTSQYTWWSFVPVFLYLTFQKTANLYFLLIGIFQIIPSVSPTDGVPLQFIPLAIVIVIDAIFAGYEDYKRHMADDLANSAKTRVFNRQLREFEEVEWREVKVGDFVKVANHEILPADIMILAVIPAEGARSGGNMGLCYVETKNLDGETNLKLREAPQPTRNMFTNEDEAGYIIQGYVESELPNGDINTYSGTLYLEENPNGGSNEGIPLALKNMLLRGSKLRNTSYVYGLVVNTGIDSKIMMSSGDEFPVKVSSIDEMTNRQVIVVVVILVAMSLAGAIGDRIWMNGLNLPTYLELGSWDDSFMEAFVYFFATLASMVPITLYVSITLVKALQGYFMERDLDMYDEESGTPMSVRNMQLNEQLGQISHIFSDKTGTLTCNKMEFRKCSIGGRSYGKGTTAIGIAARMRSDFKGSSTVDEETADENDVPLLDPRMVAPAPNVNFKDKHFWRDLQNKEDPQSGKIEEFMTLLALCHGVLIERLDPTEEDASPPVHFSASSPDELALVCGAKYFGYEFIDRQPGSVSMKKPDGVVDQYDILEVFEFDSNRKRMSVIVQRRKRDEELRLMSESEEEDVLLLTKGADSMLFPRLAPMSANNERIRESTEKHLESFAQDGLRTLVVCAKKISPQSWEQFYAQYRHASADLSQVEAKSKGLPNAIDALQDEMESNLELLGATAIEDRLQDGVPETMESLAKAGICIWVLTGDMEETAINIGYACRLLNNDMERHVINAAKYRTKGAILRKLDNIFHEIHDASDDTSRTSTIAAHSVLSPPSGQVEHALVIDGASLSKILEDPLHNLHLLRVSLLCKVVVACRVSPQQKAQLVELVKLNVPESHTLSIGDGANDVPMIQSAHIGVGISGQEGLQAVNSSDYALGQFRFLSNLILVHGRWNYNRVAALVVYTFYKNIAYNVSMFWYTLWPTGYSGTMIYSALIQQGYNLFFTSLPIVVFSAYDKDLPKKTVLEFPTLYHAEARKTSFFTHIMFWKWIFLGIVDSVGIYFAVLAIGWNIERGGNTIEYLSMETLGWTILCIVVNARFCLMVNSWDILEFGSMALTIIALYLFQYVIDQIDWSYDTDSLPWQFGRAQFWLGQLFAVVAILFKDFFYEGCRRRFVPEYLDLVKESRDEKSALSREELAEFKPPPVNYLNPELAGMIDYQDRRVHESTPVRFTAPGRSKLYTGFAFDQPANVVNWILTGTNNSGGQNSRKSINADVRNLILSSDDPVFFENQRYQPFCGYGSSFPGYLLPTDRKRWSDRSGKISAQAIPLAGLELNLDVPGCDAEGWVYENDFAFFPSTPPSENDEEEEDLELALSTGDRSSNGTFLSSRRKNKKKKTKKPRPHHGFVRRREWKLSEEFRAQQEARRGSNLSNISAVHVEDDHRLARHDDHTP